MRQLKLQLAHSVETEHCTTYTHTYVQFCSRPKVLKSLAPHTQNMMIRTLFGGDSGLLATQWQCYS